MNRLNRLATLINTCLEKNIPFVSYRLPGQTDIITWIQNTDKFLMVEDFDEVADKSGFVYAPFHRKTNLPVVFFETELVFENENFDDSVIHKISEKEPRYPDNKIERPIEISKQAYLKQAKTIVDSLDQDFPKAVLSRVQLISKSEYFNPGLFFIKLQATYQNAFCHIINIPGAGSWLGASPETLLRINADIAQTISLAGTQAFHHGDITWHKKEIEEQQIVTDFIESVLKSFEIEKYTKEKLQDLRAGDVVHLASKFNIETENIEKQLNVFISALHPTPAVCGFPKEKALELILQTEKHNREYYAGYCGPVNMNDKTDLFVNLRCMKVLKDKLALYIGGGLTTISDPEKEWDETVLKSKTLMKLL